MEAQHATPRWRRGALAGALGAIAVAVAIPVSGAFAAGDGGDGSSGDGTSETVPGFVQGQDDRQERDRLCPEDERGDLGGSAEQSAPGGSGEI
jgi:hypothetical protein